MSIRVRLWSILNASQPRAFDYFMLSLIFLNVLATVIGTVQGIHAEFGSLLDLFEFVSVIVFSIEYVIRLWLCVTESQYSGLIIGRLRYAMTPLMIIDFMAILPFYLTTGTDLRSLRAFRLMRLMRILKIGRYVPALRLIITVFRRKQAELLITVAFMMILMTVSASLVYTAEQQAQPETFLDIPTTMWWAIETLTTVGYGDMAPVTLPGRIFGAITAILGVALFAIPTGILASGFIEVVESQGTRGKCPHCGKEL